MGDILGIGATHYPPGLVPDEHKPWPLARMLHTDRDDTIRIISARPATPSERKIYEEG